MSWGNPQNSTEDQDMISYLDNDPTYRVLQVKDVHDGDESGDNKIALQTKNSSNHPNARAFRAEGKSDFLGVVKVTDELYVEGDLYSASELHQTGQVLLGLIGNGGPDIPAKIDAKGDPPDNPLDLLLGTEIYTNDLKLSHSGKTTTIQGKLEVAEGIGDVNIESLKVGASDAAGEIDSGGTQGTPQDLKIGTGAGTDEVIIARENQLTITQGRLRVGRDIAGVHGRSKIDAYTPPGHGWSSHLRIGTEEDTDNVYISRSAENIRTIIQSELRVGPDEEDGNVDAHEDLYLGSLGTNDVIISRQDHSTKVQGSLHVDENVDFDGSLKVGPEDDAGVIESGGTQVAPQNLKIGTMAETLNIYISRPGQTVIINDTIRIQLDAALNATIILNGDEALTINDPLARGIADNPVGHGFGSSMDHVINGVPRFCVDQTGGHNV